MTTRRIPAAIIRRVWSDQSQTVKQAAAALGVHEATLSRWVKLLDLPLRKRGVKPAIPNDDAEFAAMWLAGVKGACMSSKTLFCKEYGAKIEQAAEVLQHRDGSNRRSTCERGVTMADTSQYPDSIGKIKPEQNSNWQPIGAIVARLIGGAK